jgi:lysozyme
MQAKSESNLWGIDVSKWQGLIDWPKVAAAGVQFTYIKASDGIGYTDPQFRRNSGGANAVGIPAGYYHFGHPEDNSAVAEAEAFCDVVNGLPYQLPHCLDLEGVDAAALSTEDLTTWALTWMRTVKKLTGARVLLYTGAYFARDELGKAASEFPIWIAQYGATTPLANGTWKEWAAFQYSDGGTVPGIDGKVDMDYMDAEFFVEVIGVSEQGIVQDAAQKVIAVLGALHEASDNNNVKAAAHFAADKLREETGIEE